MRYIVRKLPSCTLDKTFNQIDYEIAYRDGDANQSFVASLELAGDDAVVNMEDDIILTSNFEKKITDVIKQYPDKVISFFTLKKSITEPTLMRGNTFCMSQCFYLPAGYSKQLLEYFNNGNKRKDEKGCPYDLVLGDWLSERKEGYILYQPSLVQHIEGKSRIDSRRSSKRQSTTFIE